jgi:hypothetical protein
VCTLSEQREALAERGGGHVRGLRRSGTADGFERQSTCSEALIRCTPASARKAYAVPTHRHAKLALECQAMTPKLLHAPTNKTAEYHAHATRGCTKMRGRRYHAQLERYKSVAAYRPRPCSAIGTHTRESDGRVCLEEACHEQPCVLAAWEQARAAPQFR